MNIPTIFVVFWFFLAVGLLVWPSFALDEGCPLPLNPSDVFPSPPYNYSSATFEELFTTLNRSIGSYIAQHQLPYFSVAIVHENRTIFTSGLSTTPFRIASITKTMTALGAFMLREQGLLLLDDPVTNFLPNFSIINPYGQHDTTLRELMGHAAGFPRDLCPMLMTCTDNESVILDQIAGMEMISPPWSNTPAYSNLGITVLGRAWEKATVPSVSWEEFVVERIAKPLGMMNTGTNFTTVDLAPNSNAYARQDLGWSAPAAQMFSTANDLAKFLAFLLTGYPPLISDSSIREWMSPATIFPDGRSGFSFPWELQKLNDNTTGFLLTKSGDINGYLSHIAFDPPSQVGVVVLTVYEQGRSSGSPAELADNILRAVIPAVQSVNQETMASEYAGVYTCTTSEDYLGPTLNYTVQVVEGTINVFVSPTKGLLANVSISLLNAGQPVRTAGTWSLLLKNATENSFWFGDASSCLSIYSAVSGGPDLSDPNTPGSLYTNVVVFDLPRGLLDWPAVRGQCYKAGFEPSTAAPTHSQGSSFVAGILFSFFLLFFVF